MHKYEHDSYTAELKKNFSLIYCLLRTYIIEEHEELFW